MDEQAINMAAEFLPQTDEHERPAIKVAGVLVLAYVEDGKLVVSVDVEPETGEPNPLWGENVPLSISVMDRTVFEADESGIETPAHVHCGVVGHPDPGEGMNVYIAAALDKGLPVGVFTTEALARKACDQDNGAGLTWPDDDDESARIDGAGHGEYAAIMVELDEPIGGWG